VLGTLALDAPGCGAVLRTRKAVALIAYLALQPGRRARRDQLAQMLWPRVENDAARTSLRQLLAGLRKAGEGDAALVVADGDWLELAPYIRIDAVAFEAAAARGDLAGATEAVALYRGALIADGLMVDSAEYDDWLDRERGRLCRLAVAAMERVAAAAIEGAIDRAEGLAAAERAVALDPYNEHAHRLLMELQAANGRPDLALLHYSALTETLRRELQVAPDPETQALHDRLRVGRRPIRLPATAAEGQVLPPFASPESVQAPLAGASGPNPIGAPRRTGSLTLAALVGVALALLLAAAIGVYRWIAPPPVAPKVTRLFPVAADPSVEQRPAIAPDGPRVVYTARLQDKHNVDLYLVTIGDQTPQRLTTDPEIDDNAVWTPDGSSIAFTRVSGRTPAQHRPSGGPGAGAQVAPAVPHLTLPPATASAVTLPRECPMTPACWTSTSPSYQVFSASRTADTSRTRSDMLFGTLALAQSAFGKPAVVSVGTGRALTIDIVTYFSSSALLMLRAPPQYSR